MEEILGGYSSARLLRLKTGDADCYAKLMPKRMDLSAVKRIRAICEAYRLAGMRTLTLRGYGNLEKEDKHFYIYDYIEGESLKEYSNRELSIPETRQLGVQVGRDFKRLKDVVQQEDSLLATDDISKLTEYAEKLYQEVRENDALNQLVKRFLKCEQIESLMAEMKQTTEVFLKMGPNLIHGDLKRSNLVRGKDEQIYVIDIESMRKSYDVMNLRYQITWILFPEQEMEKEFASGIFDGLYDGKRPERFNEQIRYVLMLNFLEHTTKAYKRGEDLEEYFEKMGEVMRGLEDLEKPII